jgi:hypothetical protein
MKGAMDDVRAARLTEDATWEDVAAFLVRLAKEMEELGSGIATLEGKCKRTEGGSPCEEACRPL